MLIGPSVLGAAQARKIITPVCDWFTGKPYELVNFAVPMRRDFKVARITCIAPGRGGGLIRVPLTNNTDPSSPYYYAQDSYYDNYQQSGGGGNCVASIVTLASDDVITITLDYVSCTAYVTGPSGTLVLANNADAPQTSYIGQSIHYGVKGTSSYAGRTNSAQPPRNMATLPGGGAGGTDGDAVGGAAGPCMTWKRTSDGALATSGGSGQAFGGGAVSDSSGNDTSGAQGLIVVEWGTSTLF